MGWFIPSTNAQKFYGGYKYPAAQAPTNSDSYTILLYCFVFVISIPFITFALLFSPPRTVVITQIRRHVSIVDSSPPSPYGSCLAFLLREGWSTFFPRRLASNCAYVHVRRPTAVDYFSIYANKFTISPQRDSNSR